MPLNFKKTRIENIEEVSVRIFGQGNDYLRTFEELKSQIKFENIFVVMFPDNSFNTVPEPE